MTLPMDGMGSIPSAFGETGVGEARLGPRLLVMRFKVRPRKTKTLMRSRPKVRNE